MTLSPKCTKVLKFRRCDILTMMMETEKTFTSKNCCKYWSQTHLRCRNALYYNNYCWHETTPMRSPTHTNRRARFRCQVNHTQRRDSEGLRENIRKQTKRHPLTPQHAMAPHREGPSCMQDRSAQACTLMTWYRYQK